MTDDLLPPPAPPAPSAPTPGGFAPPVAPGQGPAPAGPADGASAPRPSLITVEPDPLVQAWPEPIAAPSRRGRMNVVAIAVVGVLLLGAVAVFVLGGDGDGDGDGGGSSAPADTSLEFEELWRAELDLSAAAIADDAGLNVAWADDEVVLATVMGTSERDGQVFAIDNASGEVMWDRPMRNRVGRPESVYVAGDVTLVTESIEDDRNGDGGMEFYAVLTALDTRTGEQRWQRDDIEIGPSWVPVGDVVVATTMAEVVPETVDELVGLDLASGEEVWSFRGERPRLGLMVIRENGIVVGDGANRAVGLGLDGEQRWTLDLEWAGGMVDVSADRSDDVVGIRNGSDVNGVELETGEVLWSARVGEVDSTSFVVTEPTTGLVVSCTTTEDSTEVSAFDPGTGDELWNESFGDDAGGFVGFGDGTALLSDDGINNSGCLPLVNGRSTTVSQLTARNLADGTRAWGVDGADLFVQLSTSAMGTMGWTGGVGAARPDRSLVTDDDRRQTLFDPQTGEFFVEDYAPDEDEPTFLQLFGSSVVGYDPAAQVLFDHPDRTTEFELRDDDQPVAFEHGVLFVFDGQELTAVD